MNVSLLCSLISLSAVPVFDLPTPKRITAVLERGVSFEAGDTSLTLGPDSKASAGGPYGASGTGRYSVKGDRVIVRGRGTMACMGDESSCGDRSTLAWSFDATLVVMGASDTTLLVRIESATTTMVDLDPSPFLLGAQTGSTGSLVQLVRSAKNDQLAKDAERLISEWKDDARFTVMRGPKATNPRTVSEVLFDAGAEAEAKTVAKLLAPALGVVAVKAWPGKAPADVVVVFGDTKAK